MCDDDQILWGVFDNLRTAVIETIHTTGKTPCVTPSPHHSRQASVEKVAAKLPDPQTRSPDFMKGCIDRDDHRCVISGAVTEAKWVKNGEHEGELLGKLEDDHNIAVKWASIYTTFPQIKATMRVSKINDLENGITLYSQLHVEFQVFRIALQPTVRLSRPNTHPKEHLKEHPKFGAYLAFAFQISLL
ncbi:hypothetical protein PENPOL_c009G02051 [Penicillium polonicum]|uniref:HNH nuclease domain-containing protein n=1 Tax=Penicillium polonicum TaxID=60169 RepID=A0A1V6NFW4_PENPO|nr:hypothetical protein PENPOL_c009G02051 [Penicillium polonicum]